MNLSEYGKYNKDEISCRHPAGQIRIADDNTGAYCRKCCAWISVTDVANSAELATLRADNAKLREALNKIRMIASCAPHDDEELASQEFTTIMNEARRVLEDTSHEES